MARLRSYDFECRACAAEDVEDGVENPWDGRFDAIVTLRDDDGFDPPPCPSCESEKFVARVPSAPMVMKASWPDGRKRPDSWYIAAEAAKIRASGFGGAPKKRQETEAQARALESEATKRFKSDDS